MPLFDAQCSLVLDYVSASTGGLLAYQHQTAAALLLKLLTSLLTPEVEAIVPGTEFGYAPNITVRPKASFLDVVGAKS